MADFHSKKILGDSILRQLVRIATIATSWDKISTEPPGRSCICGYQQPNLPDLKASRPKQYAEESKVAIMTK